MMSRADRLVLGTVLGSMVTVLLVVVATLMLAALVDEMRARSDAYTLPDILVNVVLSTPDNLAEAVPFIMMVGTLLGLSQLAASSELTVFSVSGQSPLRLLGALVAPTAIAIVVAFLVSELVAPPLAASARERREVAMASSQMIWIPGGRWVRDRERFVHARAISPDGTLYGVTQLRIGEGRVESITFATRADPDSDGGWRWVDGQVTGFQEGRVQALPVVPPSRLDLDSAGSLLGTRSLVDPRRWSVAELAAEIELRERHGISSHDQQLAFWQRACRPLTAVGAMLVGVGLVVGVGRGLNRGARLALAVALGVLLQYLVELAGPVSVVYGIVPWVAVLGPTLVALAGGLGAALWQPGMPLSGFGERLDDGPVKAAG